MKIDALQKVFDVAAEHILSFMERDIPNSVFNFGRQPDDYYAITVINGESYVSPTAAVLLLLGDQKDVQVFPNVTTVGEMIEDIGSFENLSKVRNLVHGNDRSDPVTLVDLLERLEDVYASENDRKMTPLFLVHIAKEFYLRWDREYLVKHLKLEPEPVEPVEVNEDNLDTLLKGGKEAAVGFMKDLGWSMEEVLKIGDVLHDVLYPKQEQVEPEVVAETSHQGENGLTQPDFELQQGTGDVNAYTSEDIFNDFVGKMITFIKSDGYYNGKSLHVGQLIRSVKITERDSVLTHYVIIDGEKQHVVYDLASVFVCGGTSIPYSEFASVAARLKGF